MEISSLSTSLRAVSPLSSSPVRLSPLLKLGGHGFNAPCGLASPKSPTAEIQRNRMSVMAAATFSRGTRPQNTAQKQRERQNHEIVVPWNEKRSHYELLGVPCDAPQDEIRAAYRKLALQFHPDVVGMQQMDSATKLFSQINGAYRILSDPQERKAYDDQTLLSPKAQNGRAAGFSSYSSPSYSYSSRAGQSRGKNWETDQCWC